MVTIERVHSDDWQTVRAVRLAALRDSPDAFWATYEGEVDQPESWWSDFFGVCAWFIARLDDEPVGIAAGLRVEELDDERVLISMWVNPKARQNGIGRQLVEAVCRWARDDGASAIVLEVAEGNDAAASLYRSCGFVATGKSKPLDRKPSVIEHEMRRLLSEDE
jgi:ribosomal protein S18 acetylase RimI-like enzyme